MDKYLYYCEDCDKLFKLSNKGKKVKCTKCGALLKDLETSSSEYEALSPDEKEVLKMWTVVEDTKDDKAPAGPVGGTMPEVMPSASDSDSGSSLFARISSGADAASPQASPTADADDSYGQDDTGLSGSDFGTDLDFFFENQDEGIRAEADGPVSVQGNSLGGILGSIANEGTKPSEETEADYDTGLDKGSNDDFSALFDVGDDDNTLENAGGAPADNYGSKETSDSNGSNNSDGSDAGSSFFGSTDDAGSSGLGGSTVGGSMESAGGGFSFFTSMGVDKGSTSVGSGSGFSGAGSSEPLYDNMSAASSGTNAVTPAASGGTVNSVAKSASVSSNTSDDDEVMKMLNILSWVFCFAPFIMGLINLVLSKIGLQIGTPVSIALYVVIMVLDSNYMKQFGAEVGIGWKILAVLLFPPAYLFKKANAVGQKKTAAIVSLITWVLSLVFIFIAVAAIFAAASFL